MTWTLRPSSKVWGGTFLGRAYHGHAPRTGELWLWMVSQFHCEYIWRVPGRRSNSFTFPKPKKEERRTFSVKYIHLRHIGKVITALLLRRAFLARLWHPLFFEVACLLALAELISIYFLLVGISSGLHIQYNDRKKSQLIGNKYWWVLLKLANKRPQRTGDARDVPRRHAAKEER